MKKVISLILALTISFGLVACGGSGTASPAPSSGNNEPATSGPTYKMKLSHSMALTSGYHAFSENFKKLVEEGSNGDIQIEIYPASQLGGERESLEAVQLGTLEFAIAGVAPTANFAPGLEVFSLPFLFESRDQAYEYFGAEGDKVFTRLNGSGLLGLSWANSDFFDLYTSSPVEKPEDIKGYTIRCMENTLYMTYLSSLGANPVPMAFSEVPAALTNGTIDGAALGIVGSYDLSMFDGMYFCQGDINWGPSPFVMNEALYKSMPVEYQELIMTSAKASEKFLKGWHEEQLSIRLQEMIDKGCTHIEIDRDAFAKVCVQPVYDKMIKDGLVDPADITVINSYRTTEPYYTVK